MATATAPAIPRVVLQDRWDALMVWERNGGNATPEYEEFVAALAPLVNAVVGHSEADSVMDDDLLFAIGDLVVDAVDRIGIAR